MAFLRTVAVISALVASSPAAAVSLPTGSSTLGVHHSGLLAANSSSSHVALPVNLAIIADGCRCKFVGMCTCHAAQDFMDCVADSASSQLCESHDLHFFEACSGMQKVCPSVGLECHKDKATCHHSPVLIKETESEIREDLAQLKVRRCRLEEAKERGYLNADNRLRELEAIIQARIDMLEAKKVPQKDMPYMGCGPEPEKLQVVVPKKEGRTEKEKMVVETDEASASDTGSSLPVQDMKGLEKELKDTAAAAERQVKVVGADSSAVERTVKDAAASAGAAESEATGNSSAALEPIDAEESKPMKTKESKTPVDKSRGLWTGNMARGVDKAFKRIESFLQW